MPRLLRSLVVLAYCLTSTVTAWTSLADRLVGRAPIPRTFLPRRHTSANRQECRSCRSNNFYASKTALRQSSSSLDTDYPEQEQQQYFTSVGDSKESLMDDDSLALVETIVKAADGRKADDIVALNVAGITTMTRYLVIVSGNSRPQNQAIANAVRIQVEEVFDGMRPGATGVPEGSADSGWMVLDYGSVMLHIMTPKSRLYYNVQGQWTAKGGVPVDVSGYLVPNAPPAAAVTDNAADNAASAEQDPFWS